MNLDLKLNFKLNLQVKQYKTCMKFKVLSQISGKIASLLTV